MKILWLASANSIHTKRWVSSLTLQGLTIVLISLTNEESNFYVERGIKVYEFGFKKVNTLNKIRYIGIIRKLKFIIALETPDIIHAHYASSYGLLGALSGFHPYIVSVWGSDVYDFPNNWLTKKILKYTLKKADRILSTSNVMAKETRKYTDKSIEITPFGVDVDRFRPIDGVAPADRFIVGNVKTLSPKYGIDVLIRAFKFVVDNNPRLPMSLEIYGDGPCRGEYEQLVLDLGLERLVTFHGFVDNAQLPEVYNSVSVSVFVSDSESFGVVAVEAMACECPVVVSDADGFTEVVKDGGTGFIVPKRDVEATAHAIQQFIDQPLLREEMGKKGRERVLKLYDWRKNVDTMVEIYNNVLYEHSSY